jgi:AcrR family transcriptional regulator
MKSEKPYHHGNLREALLGAALRLISEVGPNAFTLREVARRAGVSHNAPYRHFRDREELMAAVSAQGFGELTRAMVEGAQLESAAFDRLKRAGLAYVKFALRRPEHFTVMFDTPASAAAGNLCFGSTPSKWMYPDAAEAAEHAFRTLKGLVEACQQRGVMPEGDPKAFALLTWSVVHGVAKLAITGRFPFTTQKDILHFAGDVIDASLASLKPTPFAAFPVDGLH